jgi:hypothetical protein
MSALTKVYYIIPEDKDELDNPNCFMYFLFKIFRIKKP